MHLQGKIFFLQEFASNFELYTRKYRSLWLMPYSVSHKMAKFDPPPLPFFPLLSSFTKLGHTLLYTGLLTRKFMSHEEMDHALWEMAKTFIIFFFLIGPTALMATSFAIS